MYHFSIIQSSLTALKTSVQQFLKPLFKSKVEGIGEVEGYHPACGFKDKARCDP